MPVKSSRSWFEDRWDDRWCVDISDELVQIIDESWAREESIPPYHVYVKIAYHLSQEARDGLSEFRIPRDFGNKLLEFQTAAVKIAAHHLNKRGGVLIGDVVGLGKTLMATALARVLEDDLGLETLIICPEEPCPHVGGLSGAIPHARRARIVDQPRDQRTARHAPLSTHHNRRKPKSEEPRGQALSGDTGIHP